MMGTFSLQAQQEVAKGNSILNLGIGAVSGFGGNVSFDYGVIDHWGPGIFTVGGYFGASARTWKHEGIGGVLFYGEETLTSMMIAARATYRYSVTRQFEAYGVIMPGVLVKLRKYTGNFENTSDILPDVGVLAGCRYLFSDKVSVFAEAGYNVLCLNAGLSFTF
jgi:hypothetical protein